MTQKKSSNEAEKEEEVVIASEPEVDVKIEGDPEPEAPKQEEPPVKQDDDVDALKKQIDALKNAQEASRKDSELRAQQAAAQMESFKASAEKSEYDSILTAMGAAQIEIDSAKRDIIMAGSAQDYGALADAQERLAAAKSHQISLEQGKNAYDAQAKQQQASPRQVDPIEAMTGLSYDEKSWLRSHPDALSNPRSNARLNAAYYDAMDKGLARDSREYFNFIEERLGYRQPEEKPMQSVPEESSVMVAAPPSKSVPANSGVGGRKTSFTLTKDEAEVARLSGITPQEYVKQREIFRGQRKAHPDDYPER